MQKQIKAIFLLGLFSMLQMHQVIPHWHHQHESAKIITEHLDDHHHHHHDTSDQPEQSKSDFIDFFLDMHTHSLVSNEVFTIITVAAQQAIVKKNASHQYTLFNTTEFRTYVNVVKPSFYHPPNTYFNPYIAQLSLRGPPVLA